MSSLLELTVPVAVTDPDHASVLAAAAILERYVSGAAVVELSGFGPYGEKDHVQTLVRGYVRDEPEQRLPLESLRRELLASLHADRYGELQTRYWRDEAWAEVWKQHYKPMHIGQRLIISPSWETPETGPEDLVIRLDPGMAFGTGTHPSTQLILRLLERHLIPGVAMLDVGTGSGILAIAAVRLGASSVLASDIDPDAIATAEENLRLNNAAAKVTLTPGSVPDRGRYPLICANILADVIAELLTRQGLAERLSEDGVMLLSGIIRARRHVVDLALASQNMRVVDTVQEGDWLAFAARKIQSIPDDG